MGMLSSWGGPCPLRGAHPLRGDPVLSGGLLGGPCPFWGAILSGGPVLSGETLSSGGPCPLWGDLVLWGTLSSLGVGTVFSPVAPVPLGGALSSLGGRPLRGALSSLGGGHPLGRPCPLSGGPSSQGGPCPLGDPIPGGALSSLGGPCPLGDPVLWGGPCPLGVTLSSLRDPVLSGGGDRVLSGGPCPSWGGLCPLCREGPCLLGSSAPHSMAPADVPGGRHPLPTTWAQCVQ